MFLTFFSVSVILSKGLNMITAAVFKFGFYVVTDLGTTFQCEISSPYILAQFTDLCS